MNTLFPSRFFLLLMITTAVVKTVSASEPDGEALHLAGSLSQEGHHAAAAVEFRRLALGSTSNVTRASLYWAAAYEYGKAKDLPLAEKMLNQAEDCNPGLATEAILLRGMNASSDETWSEAEFYFRGLTQGTTQTVSRLASRQLAVTRLRQHNVAGAREALALSPNAEQPGQQSLERYSHGADKSPRIGGLLGLIPGLGYAYSGEYANAARSLILNSLFIFGVVKTAEDDQWGACTAISFFEITWYSGSIYGGVDAAYRYNQDRMNRCADDIVGKSEMTPDYSQLPILTLQYRF